MTGSYRGSSPKVLAKQPFSVVYTLPPGISATKSSWAGLLSSWVVNVVVVLPVPDSPTIRIVVGSDRVVELLLHSGDVRVGRLHNEPGPGAEIRIGSDVAVDHDHVLACGVGVLLGGDPGEFGPRDGLLGGVG